VLGVLRLALQGLGDDERVGGLEERALEEVVDPRPSAGAQLRLDRLDVVVGAAVLDVGPSSAQ
jgi:hypothetical protein